MQISLNWLKELVDFDLDLDTLVDRLTMIGTACEAVDPVAGELNNVVVGKIISAEIHPNAQSLKVCKVDIGGDTKITVICGAPNVRVGMKTPLALPGAVIGDNMKITSVDKYGISSDGVLCSEAELGLSDDHSGIMDLEASLSVGAPVKTALDLDDYAITFELTPNRPDCLSAIGIARDIAALTGNPIKRSVIKVKETGKLTADEVKVSIEDPDACPRYAARLIENIRVGQSPWWLKQRLLASGIRSINNIVDITNYVMLEYGQPLHAFDYDNFSHKEVVIRRAKEDEKFTTLDGVERTLNPDILLITDGDDPVAIGGIMGGEFSEVSDKTKNILLESAYFNPLVIRRGRKYINLTSESQRRFEGGADPNIVTTALDRAANMIAELSRGKVLSGIVDCYPEPISPITLKLRPVRVNQILATDISSPKMIDILNSLEFQVRPGKNLTVEVPTFRPDITREIDLIEEIARVYGYENIEPQMSAGGKLVARRHEPEHYASKLRTALTTQGYFEVVTNSIVDPKQIRVLDKEVNCLEVLNPISEDLKWMRPSLVSSLLNVVRHNLNRRVKTVKIFEIGTIFLPADGELAKEENVVALALSGGDRGENWTFHPGDFGFYDLRGALEEIESLVEGTITLSVVSSNIFKSDCSFNVLLDGNEIGVCGSIAKNVLDGFEIKTDVFLAELYFNSLYQKRYATRFYNHLPKFPSSERDIAVVVEEDTIVSDMLETIRASADHTLKDTVVFDVFKGRQIEKGMKSVAFRLLFQDESKTLTDADIDKLFNNIVNELKKRHLAELRS